jgi:23S rRNA pseudouridine1911/1915/1917 synthase
LQTFSRNLKLGQDYGVFHFETALAGSASEVIASHLKLPLEKVNELLWLGSVYCNGIRLEKDVAVKLSDYLRVHTKPRRYDIRAAQFPELIVYRNEEFLVINKPSAIPVHATVDNSRENIVNELTLKLGVKIGVTHRLDNATSGLMVFALTENFQREFNTMLRSGKVQKIYRAKVHGKNVMSKFLSRTWVHYMEPSPRAPKKVSRDSNADWQKCVLHILSAQDRSDDQSELIIELETGRTHQIRAQLSHEGHPIVGDSLYGSPLPNKDEKISLQSCKLKFAGHEFSIT